MLDMLRSTSVWKVFPARIEAGADAIGVREPSVLRIWNATFTYFWLRCGVTLRRSHVNGTRAKSSKFCPAVAPVPYAWFTK